MTEYRHLIKANTNASASRQALGPRDGNQTISEKNLDGDKSVTPPRPSIPAHAGQGSPDLQPHPDGDTPESPPMSTGLVPDERSPHEFPASKLRSNRLDIDTDRFASPP